MKIPHYSYQILIILLIAIVYNKCHKKEPVDWTPTHKMSTPMPDHAYIKFPPDYDSTVKVPGYTNKSNTTTEQEELIIRERIIVDKNGVVHRIKYIEP